MERQKENGCHICEAPAASEFCDECREELALEPGDQIYLDAYEYEGDA